MQHEKMKQLFAGTGINCLKTGANKTVIAAPAPADEHIAPATARSARASGGTHRASASRVRSASAHDQNKTTQISRRARHLSQNKSSARRQPLQPPARNGYGRGVLSAQRHGVEQQSLAYTVSPRRALPLPLSDVV